MGTFPVLLMAKVNQLIAEGEWWRLVTTSFLVRFKLMLLEDDFKGFREFHHITDTE